MLLGTEALGKESILLNSWLDLNQTSNLPDGTLSDSFSEGELKKSLFDQYLTPGWTGDSLNSKQALAIKHLLDQLKDFESKGFGNLPICIAKTQYSFSTDPSLKGAPSGHVLPIREVRLSSGAEFVVVICGAIMTMPGLPRVPAADSIKLNNKGDIEGLF